MDILYSWLSNNLLVVVCLSLTFIFLYHYFIEKDIGTRLSKKYRSSIYEAQSKVFLNATQYLISGNRDLAIKEFLNAVDINRETIETYFALGGLFRSNGEIGKAISIHRSLISRKNISEETRLRALKELAIDFDKGGFVDKAISAYKDVLKINREQPDIIESLCRIYEDIEDWDHAHSYRLMLSKVSHENQSETISHILVQKAKKSLEQGDINSCKDNLEQAFRFSPSISAIILQIYLSLHIGDVDRAQNILIELLKEHKMYASFVFEFLNNDYDHQTEAYKKRVDMLKKFFINIDDHDLMNSSSVLLSKVRLLKEDSKIQEAYNLLDKWIKSNKNNSEILLAEHMRLLVLLDKKEEIETSLNMLLSIIHKSLTKYFCSNCGYNSDELFWRCPQCHKWETIKFRWKI